MLAVAAVWVSSKMALAPPCVWSGLFSRQAGRNKTRHLCDGSSLCKEKKTILADSL